MRRLIQLISFISSFNLLGFQAVSAQSIASSLAGYQKKLGLSVSGVSGSNFSGVAFFPHSRTLYVVDDANETVYELSTAGNLIRSISLSGFNDTEGIAYQMGNYFFIAEERLANIVRVELPLTGSGPVDRDKGVIFSISENWSNQGLEGVTYNLASSTVYAVKEINPTTLYRIKLDNDGNPTEFFKNDPFNLENTDGDAAGIYALSDGTFLIVNQMQNKLTGYSKTGKKLSELWLMMNKPEGITVDERNGTLYVVGERRELYVFENPGLTGLTPQPDIPQSGFSCAHRNPSHKRIIFNYNLPFTGKFQLAILNLKGQRIINPVDDKNISGNNQLLWNGGKFQPGIYLFVYSAGEY
ncbi:MAG: SdiA-regulated domain-containing protein [Chitinispirillia bacterium]